MFKKMKHMKNEKGLTLIELLAVIVILAIIAAIAIPAIGNIIQNQRDKAVLAEISGVFSAAKIAHVDGNCGPTTADVCEYTEITDFVNAKGFGTAGDQVTMGTDPVIIYTLGTNETIKGKKIYEQLSPTNGTSDKYSAAISSGSKISISESKLNTLLGK